MGCCGSNCWRRYFFWGFQILSNISEGKTWHSDVAGAAIGGAVNGAILTATGGASLLMSSGTTLLVTTGVAAFASSTVQSFINETEGYVTGEAPFDIEDVQQNTLKNGLINWAGNYLGAKLIRTSNSWFTPTSWNSFFTKSYGPKIMAQSVFGGTMSFSESLLESMYSNGTKCVTSTVSK